MNPTIHGLLGDKKCHCLPHLTLTSDLTIEFIPTGESITHCNNVEISKFGSHPEVMECRFRSEGPLV